MDDQLLYAERVLPELRELAQDVLRLSNSVGLLDFDPGNLERDEEARLRQMVVLYASTQHEHLVSVLALVNSGQHRDAWLIARTMIEGYAQLAWAVEHGPVGPDEWFWFGVVEDWRQLRENRSKGLPVSRKAETQTANWLRDHGARYYTVKARDALKYGQPIPDDPYRDKWHRLQIRQMFEGIERLTLYLSVYDPASEWVHWNPRALFRTAVQPDGRVKYSPHDPMREAQALVIAISSVLDTLEILSQTYGVELSDDHENAWDRLSMTMNSMR